LFIILSISSSSKKAKVTRVRVIDKIRESLIILAGVILQSASETSRDICNEPSVPCLQQGTCLLA
jgi:hypothetical protein